MAAARTSESFRILFSLSIILPPPALSLRTKERRQNCVVRASPSCFCAPLSRVRGPLIDRPLACGCLPSFFCGLATRAVGLRAAACKSLLTHPREGGGLELI